MFAVAASFKLLCPHKGLLFLGTHQQKCRRAGLRITACAVAGDEEELDRAVELEGLDRALEVLDVGERSNEQGNQDLLSILDDCIQASDMKLVVRTYAFLRRKGLLQNFGKCKSRDTASEAEGRMVTPLLMKQVAGIEASQLSPRKRAIPVFIVTALIIFQLIVRSIGLDARPLLIIFLALGLADTFYFKGMLLSQIQTLWPPYRRRVMVHEAGHVVVAYLLGCPIRGVILDAVQAMKLGIPGQAGTQFWDSALEQELLRGRLTMASIDRYCMVLFAGIAAEALVYGQAEGGESDQNMYLSIISGLSPPWSAMKKKNQARSAVLQAYKLLKEHEHVHKAVTEALENGAPLSNIIKTIEETIKET